MELNRDQIVKALECCFGNSTCAECPYNDWVGCHRQMMKNAIALINELTEENERLRGFNSAKCEDCAGCTSWNCDCDNIEAQVKADTVRKMQE